uniref:Tumor necrosis factor ligand superfamily, receptor-ligand complex, TNFSF, TNFRSF n=1 Tax=Myoviridae sp. ctXwe21 TaxID=2825123 RepID=A0A8S5PYJ1_9CAUD|nr:MAG TPA: Tumor necrosis factor ligand superfamily, receptor-ligand complex, TNFSF, TNFRSF [Myoviridae sp. ctXwe21]
MIINRYYLYNICVILILFINSIGCIRLRCDGLYFMSRTGEQ